MHVMGDMMTGTLKDVTISNWSTGDSCNVEMKTNTQNSRREIWSEAFSLNAVDLKSDI